MFKQLMVTLTPLEPYFFGGERIFEMNERNKHYFIRSLDTPSQTTLFGALRFIGIKNTAKGNYLDEKSDVPQIGRESYDLVKEEQDFRRIQNISPLYLLDDKGRLCVRTPFDHQCGNPFYTRFERYAKVRTDRGVCCLPMDYRAKDGLADSWMCLEDRAVYGDSASPEEYQKLFPGVVRTIVAKKKETKGFAKKEYKQLKPGFSFVFFATVKRDFEAYQPIVYLGQGKSTFAVAVSERPEPLFPREFLRDGMAYAQSDLYLEPRLGDWETVYQNCRFVCVKTRDFRVFTTKYDEGPGGGVQIENRYNKKKSQIKLLQAGSVFWPDDLERFLKRLNNGHARVAGFNQIVIGGKGR